MAVFPVTPRHSRMLLQLAVWQQQQQQGLAGAGSGGVSAAAAAKALPYAVALAATLSVESPFMHIDALNAETDAAAADADASKPQAAAGEGEDDEDGEDGGQQKVDPKQQQRTAEAKAANRRKMQAASAAHARFRSPHGDAISALNALCAYEAAAAAAAAAGGGRGRGGGEGGVEEFCAANFLHARHLREMSQLRQQLGRTLLQLQQGLSSQQGQGQGLSGPQQLPALSAGGGGAAAEAQQLMQRLLAGLSGDAGQQQLSQPLSPPSAAVLEVLRRALAAGWCDQVGPWRHCFAVYVCDPNNNSMCLRRPHVYSWAYKL